VLQVVHEPQVLHAAHLLRVRRQDREEVRLLRRLRANNIALPLLQGHLAAHGPGPVPGAQDAGVQNVRPRGGTAARHGRAAKRSAVAITRATHSRNARISISIRVNFMSAKRTPLEMLLDPHVPIARAFRNADPYVQLGLVTILAILLAALLKEP
jgi:hypothetical protein